MIAPEGDGGGRPAAGEAAESTHTAQPAPDGLAEQMREAPLVTVLLDYDGTLVPVASRPSLAAPDPGLQALLARLVARPGLDAHIVSGRRRATLDRWLGLHHLSLWAEHGYWHRPKGHRAWRADMELPPDWSAPVLPIFEAFTAQTPGSFVEPKTAALTWHYRLAPAPLGAERAHALLAQLRPFEQSHGLEVLEGRKVVEVRVRGVSKAAVARYLCQARTDGPIVAIGDDRTDEDLFAALPDTAVTIAVGDRPSRARYRLPHSPAVRDWLGRLTD